MRGRWQKWELDILERSCPTGTQMELVAEVRRFHTLISAPSGITADGELYGHGDEKAHLYCGHCGAGEIDPACPLGALAAEAEAILKEEQ